MRSARWPSERSSSSASRCSRRSRCCPRVATEHAYALTGPGFGAPVHVLTHDDPGTLAHRLARVPGVAHVERPARSADGSQWLVDATLAVPVVSAEAHDVVHRIEQMAGP